MAAPGRAPTATGEDTLFREFGIGPAALIGAGAQSRVYALDDLRVVRILRRPAEIGSLVRLQRFLAGIDGRLPFPTSRIEAIDADGRYTIERRLAGRSMLARLDDLAGDARRTAFANFLLAAEGVGTLAIADRPYGQILADEPIVAPTWRDYLTRSLDRYIAANAEAIEGSVGDVEALRRKALALLDRVPPLPPKVLVHGDYFPGNVMLGDDLGVSGLVDFSVFTVVGDRLLDIVGSAIFLEMIEPPTAVDIARAREHVLARHGPAVAAAGPFYRAYFAFAMTDPTNGGGPYPKLFRWGVENLTALASGAIRF